MQNASAKKTDVIEQVFNGSANFKDEAQSNAEIKQHIWVGQNNRRKIKLLELDREYVFRQINEVYWKCDLKVSYRVISK